MNRFLVRYEKLGEVFDPKAVKIADCLRVNTLKISPDTLYQRLKQKKVRLQVPDFIDGAFFYSADFSLGATQEYLSGYYYLQEAASQLPVLVLNPKPDESVLDMCASPGSKTTQIAAFMKNNGCVLALDSSGPRLTSLISNLSRLGIRNVLVFKKDARFVADFGLFFDKILLDAPCSGNFLIEKNFFETKSLDDIQELSRIQKGLLRAAYSALKPGGVLVYSTCSLEPEENEMNISWFAEEYKDMVIEKTGLAIGDPGIVNPFGVVLCSDIALTRRLWPHKTKTQGFFIARLRKKL